MKTRLLKLNKDEELNNPLGRSFIKLKKGIKEVSDDTRPGVEPGVGNGIRRYRVVSINNDRRIHNPDDSKHIDSALVKANRQSLFTNADKLTNKIKRANNALDRTQSRVYSAGRGAVRDQFAMAKRIISLGRWRQKPDNAPGLSSKTVRKSRPAKKSKFNKAGTRLITYAYSTLSSDNPNEGEGREAAATSGIAVSLVVKFVMLTVLISQILAKLVMIVISSIIFIVAAVIANVSAIIIIVAAIVMVITSIVVFISADEDKDDEGISDVGWYHFSDVYEELDAEYETRITTLINSGSYDGYRIEGDKASAEEITKLFTAISIHNKNDINIHDMLTIDEYRLLNEIYWQVNSINYSVVKEIHSVVTEDRDDYGNRVEKVVDVELSIIVITASKKTTEDVAKIYNIDSIDVSEYKEQYLMYLKSIKNEYHLNVEEKIY